ncbi:MAG: Stk1 family PASTA domain-containing Ser/Thr kinase [Candidatus Eremiobacteraeota bacterium]|nr:Stk1 family PASTA domain-containing Ser/Thr kinase [Candidatus Eremiobacteraeota bacterium]
MARDVIERNLSERYRLEGRIGQGGMAVVYAGTDTVLRRRVAIKVLRPHLAADADFVQRFYSEAHHAAKLSHPNIVNIYDVGRAGDDYFIVMELVEGATLAEMIEADGPLPEAVAIDYAAQICSGLAYAHRQGLLHRDIKPANVLVTKDDVVKLSDFGIARAVSTQTMTVTQPGLVMGSVYYISPEQAQGHELRETSDLYSLGIVLYQMLSGKLPYGGDSPITVALKHVSGPVPSLDPGELPVSPALAAIVRRLMAKDPQERFSSAGEVAKALREAREHPSLAAPFESARQTTTAPFEAVRDPARAAAGPREMPPPKPRPSRFPDRTPAPAIAAYGDDGARDVAAPARQARPLLGVLLVLVLAAAIATGYYASRPGGWFVAPAQVTVASLVGRNVDSAQHALDASGLTYDVVSMTSATVPAHRVIRQDPLPGTRVGEHTLVTLYVSAGLPTIHLIDMRHYSSDDAQRYLREAKLVPKLVGTYDPTPAGTVLAQHPAAGTSIPIHSTVALTVSKGPQPITVPDLTALTLADATKVLRGRGLGIDVADSTPSDDIPANEVMSQSVQAGSSVSPGATVNVRISSGPAKFAIPALTGQEAADGIARLQAAGFNTNIEYVVDEDSPSGTILKQDPPDGSHVNKGATVTLSVAVPGLVPDVGGKSPGDARVSLQNAGYKVGNIAYTQEGTEGTVVRTEPAAGTSLSPGETVMMFVSGVNGDVTAPPSAAPTAAGSPPSQ